jgi:hypothetical protein
MKKGLLNFKTAFCLMGLLLVTSSVSLASASFCKGVLLESQIAPNKEQLQAAIQHLAKLRLDLDLQRNDKSKVAAGMVKILAQKYQSELFNLQEASKGKYKAEEIKTRIADEIAIMQGFKNRESEIEVQKIEEQRKAFTENFDDLDFIDQTVKNRVASFTPEKMTPPKPSISFFQKIASHFKKKPSQEFLARGVTFESSPLTGTEQALRDLAYTTKKNFVHVEFLDESGLSLGESAAVDSKFAYYSVFDHALGISWNHGKIFKIKKCIVTIVKFSNREIPSTMLDDDKSLFLSVKAYLEGMSFNDVSIEGSLLYLENQNIHKQSIQIPYSTMARNGDYELARAAENIHMTYHHGLHELIPNTEYGDFSDARVWAERIFSDPSIERTYLLLGNWHTTSAEHGAAGITYLKSEYLETFEVLKEQYRK